MLTGDDLAVGDQQGDAAAGHHQDQRGDDRLDADHRDEQPVPGAEHAARPRAPGRARSHARWPGCLVAPRRLMCRQATAPAMAHDRADRQVDAAGGDDQGHARARPASAARRCAGCRSRLPYRWPSCTATARKPGAVDDVRDEQDQQHQRPARTAGARSAADGGSGDAVHRSCLLPAGPLAMVLHDAVGVERRRRWRARRPSAGRACTATRSLSRSTSSSSAEMNSTAMPSSAELGDQLLDLGLGADVDAAGRLVEDQQPRLGDQPAGQQHLLLVAAGQVARPARPGRRAGCPAPRCTSRPARPGVGAGSGATSRGRPAGPG